jgi:hypothetical protein
MRLTWSHIGPYVGHSGAVSDQMVVILAGDLVPLPTILEPLRLSRTWFPGHVSLFDLVPFRTIWAWFPDSRVLMHAGVGVEAASLLELENALQNGCPTGIAYDEDSYDGGGGGGGPPLVPDSFGLWCHAMKRWEISVGCG